LANDLLGRVGFFGQPGLTQLVREQLSRLRFVESPQRQRGPAMGGDQATELVPARDQDRIRRSAGKQRDDVFVVEHHEQPAPGREGPIPRRLPVRLQRN
jgi:hypothetical protein